MEVSQAAVIYGKEALYAVDRAIDKAYNFGANNTARDQINVVQGVINQLNEELSKEKIATNQSIIRIQIDGVKIALKELRKRKDLPHG